jgi:hypothetical protein
VRLSTALLLGQSPSLAMPQQPPPWSSAAGHTLRQLFGFGGGGRRETQTKNHIAGARVAAFAAAALKPQR